MSFAEHNTYTQERFRKHITSEVSILFELGTRDGLFAKELQEVYSPQQLHLFECNSQFFKDIERNIENLSNVFLHKHAILDYDGEVSFYPLVTEDIIESGSSSMFKYDASKNISQREVTVPCKTLDTFCKENNINKVDLICADIEGSEHLAFKNQNILNTVSYIITEVQVDPNWKPGFPTIKDLEKSLSPYGFVRKELVWGPTTPNIAGDALYVKEETK